MMRRGCTEKGDGTRLPKSKPFTLDGVDLYWESERWWLFGFDFAAQIGLFA